MRVVATLYYSCLAIEAAVVQIPSLMELSARAAAKSLLQSSLDRKSSTDDEAVKRFLAAYSGKYARLVEGKGTGRIYQKAADELLQSSQYAADLHALINSGFACEPECHKLLTTFKRFLSSDLYHSMPRFFKISEIDPLEPQFDIFPIESKRFRIFNKLLEFDHDCTTDPCEPALYWNGKFPTIRTQQHTIWLDLGFSVGVKINRNAAVFSPNHQLIAWLDDEQRVMAANQFSIEELHTFPEPMRSFRAKPALVRWLRMRLTATTLEKYARKDFDYLGIVNETPNGVAIETGYSPRHVASLKALVIAVSLLLFPTTVVLHHTTPAGYIPKPAINMVLLCYYCFLGGIFGIDTIRYMAYKFQVS
jgi:hypothetical protein